MTRAWKALRRFWESDPGLSVFLGLLVFFLFALPLLVEPERSGRSRVVDLGFSALLLAGVAALSARPAVRAALFALVVGAFASTGLGGPGRPDFIYFSFVTLTPVGYGDVTPVHPVAGSLAVAEALTDNSTRRSCSPASSRWQRSAGLPARPQEPRDDRSRTLIDAVFYLTGIAQGG